MVKKRLTDGVSYIIEDLDESLYIEPNNSSNINIDLLSNSSATILVLINGNYKTNININFLGIYSNVVLNVLSLHNSTNEQTSVIVNHNNNNNTSRITNLVVANNKSSVNSYGNVIINENIEFSNTYLKQRGIIIDNESVITFNPVLSIKNLESKAGHGSVVGGVDEEQVYYLMSRGLSRKDSMNLILRSYIDPLIKGFEEANIEEIIKNYV
jgi:hypothetical protein